MSDSRGTAFPALRQDAWLQERVELLRRVHFSDAPQGLPIQAAFGRRAKNRLGVIMRRQNVCKIVLNGLMALSEVPDFVVDATIVHELVHYLHGFGSGLPRLHSHPHKGGVVDIELEARGLVPVTVAADDWRKRCWASLVACHTTDLQNSAARRAKERSDLWQTYLRTSGFRTESELQATAREITRRLGWEHAPFRVEWLRAGKRHTWLSYYWQSSRILRLHGVLAHPRVSDDVVKLEIAWWAASLRHGARWSAVEKALIEARLLPMLDGAVRWRRQRWNSFLRKHHPLLSRA